MGDSLAFSLSNVMNNPPAKMAKNVNDLDLKIKKIHYYYILHVLHE